MTKVLMVQGTMSNAGKSLLCAGLCRIFRQDGLRVAPFKSQNMALNSYATAEGLEMGRAQVVQAEAAGIAPSVRMNPILLKPTDNEGSQVIVNGKPVGNMKAREYYARKKELVPVIKEAFRSLAAENDVIVIEGAGSPAEINLKENDIVNMGMAAMVDAPVLLVGDIDRGGVFAQLLGTLMLLDDDEKARVKGLVINKFRGDASLLDSGITLLEERGGVPVIGTVPYMDIRIEDEDSLSERLARRSPGEVDLAVIRFPRISNFSDFDVFEQIPQASVRYVSRAAELGCPDLLILPGSKSTISDLRWLRERGFEPEIRRLFREGVPVIGICGGYQMLGVSVSDPAGAEGGGAEEGLGLLPVRTVLAETKRTEQVRTSFGKVRGILSGLSGRRAEGYEIHMGATSLAETPEDDAQPFLEEEGAQAGNVYGTYLHGVFDLAGNAQAVVKALAEKKGMVFEEGDVMDHAVYKEREYDRLADTLREHLDMRKIYGMLREAKLGDH